jgi:hypothetical protein
MRTLLTNIWHDETGTIPVEWACITTILILGAITGVLASRQSRWNDTPASSSAQPAPHVR